MDEFTTVPSFTKESIRKRGIPGSTLKLIAIFVMLIDHIAATILLQLLISRGYFYNTVAGTDSVNGLLIVIYGIMRDIGRLGFPLFCFLLVEGFVHTRNKGKYVVRLGLFALISEIPFDLAFNGKAFYFGYQNVFFTLLAGFLVLCGFHFIKDNLKEKKWFPVLSVAGIAAGGWIAYQVLQSILFVMNSILAGYTGKEFSSINTQLGRDVLIGVIAAAGAVFLIRYLINRKKDESIGIILADCIVIAAGMVLANFLHSDYSGFGVLTIAVMYALRRNPVISGLGGYIVLSIMSLTELPAIFALIPIKLYNGERGLKLKYVFYAFYPVHLFILYLICKAMKLI